MPDDASPGSVIQTPRPMRRRLRNFRRMFGGAAPAPLELQILGRILLHAAAVGAAAGLLGSLFFAGVEAMQRVFLERLTGYIPLRASGERILGEVETVYPF